MSTYLAGSSEDFVHAYKEIRRYRQQERQVGVPCSLEDPLLMGI